MIKHERTKWLILLLTAVMLLMIGTPILYYKEKHGGLVVSDAQQQELEKVKTIEKPKDSYDVIVVGTDPEGVVAGVSAARNGMKTLLVDGKNREILGGLMTRGWLNTIDLNQDKDKLVTLPGQKPAVLNKGIFQEWYDMIEGTSFDVITAANAFNKLAAKEKNLDVLLKTLSIEPMLKTGKENSRILEGIQITLADGSKQTVKAKAVIDATQDADIAAAAGVSFTVGREDLGDPKSKMAVTVVFRLKNADAEFWKEARKRMDNDGNEETGSDEHSIWGYGELQKYPPVNKERVRMRGLNFGRQNDNSILINALQIFGIDPLDQKSRDEAFTIASNELPHIIEHMKKLYPEFGKLELEGLAPELYVRETRHMQGVYRLTIDDVLDNRDQWDRIAFGSYRVDLQRTSPTDNGAEILAPYKYAIPFRSLVPQTVDGLLVVGRSASYDTLAHGTARVIPTGMAEGQAAGAAAKIAIDKGISFRDLADNKEQIAKLQELLNGSQMKMELKPYTAKKQPYQEHKAYMGLKAAVYLGIAAGGGNNDFKLDDPSNPQRWSNNIAAAKRKYPASFKGDPAASIAGMADASKKQLTLPQACLTVAKAVGLNVSMDKAQQELEAKHLLNAKTIEQISDKQKLTNGDAYLILKDVLENLVSVRF